MGGHIWVVLSGPTPSGDIAIVSLSKHGRPRFPDHPRCTVVRAAEYPVLRSDSCAILHSAILNPLRPLLASQAAGHLAQRDPVPFPILQRIQRAVLDYGPTRHPVRDAIRATIDAAPQ